MLAESEKKDLFIDAFDMGYNWEGHHIMNELAQGKTDVNSWDEYMLRVEENYQSDDILMNFITNMMRIHGTVVLLKEWVTQVKQC